MSPEELDNSVARSLFKIRLLLETSTDQEHKHTYAVAAKAFAIACDSPSCGLIRVAAASLRGARKRDDLVSALVAEIATHLPARSADVLRATYAQVLGKTIAEPETALAR